jgi:hypothetical protein
LKTWKALTIKQKGMLLGKTSKKGTPLGHPLILKTCLHVKHFHLEPPTKKEEAKEAKPKGMLWISMPLRGNKT